MTQWVIEACTEAASFAQRSILLPQQFDCQVALLVPHGDPLATEHRGSCLIVEGPEADVLARYGEAMESQGADWVVRITGDCPTIPSYLIGMHIKKAVRGNLDYCSNVDERWRTCADGWDCEVISARLLRYVMQRASTKDDREHVTTYLRRSPPQWARIASVVGYMNSFKPECKLSVDTEEDLERVREYFGDIDRKINAARVAGQLVFRL